MDQQVRRNTRRQGGVERRKAGRGQWGEMANTGVGGSTESRHSPPGLRKLIPHAGLKSSPRLRLSASTKWAAM